LLLLGDDLRSGNTVPIPVVESLGGLNVWDAIAKRIADAITVWQHQPIVESPDLLPYRFRISAQN
jgi:hypothetical protein